MAVLLVLVACTGDDPIEATLPSPTAAPSTPTPAPTPTGEPSPEDPFAVPEEIDAAYVERVLNEINRLDAELTRDILRRPVDPDAVELPEADQQVLDSLYEEPILTLNTNATVALLRSQEERDDLLPATEYGQLRMTVERILAVEPCMVALVDRDFSQTDAELTGSRSTLGVAFLSNGNQPNLTGWKLARLLGSDATPGSQDEQEMRALTATDLEGQWPVVCQ